MEEELSSPSPVRAFKNVDFYTVAYETPSRLGESEPELFPFGDQSGKRDSKEKHRSMSHVGRQAIESTLKKRILNILDTTSHEGFTTHCQKYSIKSFLKSQQAMNNDIYYEIVEHETVDQSMAKFTEHLVEDRKAELLATPPEDNRANHSFSLSNVCSSNRKSKGKPTMTFNDWLSKAR